MSFNHNKTAVDDSENQALYYPSRTICFKSRSVLIVLLITEDGPNNFWMYAVIAAGSSFVIFVSIALYTVW
jgi:hypothetical protein